MSNSLTNTLPAQGQRVRVVTRDGKESEGKFVADNNWQIKGYPNDLFNSDIIEWKPLVTGDECDDHTRLQELVLKHIPNANVTGDSYGVPGILDLADMLANRLVEAEAALKESKSRIRLLGETLAEHVSEEFMEARGLDWENWSSNNSVCTAPACGQPNPEPPYGEGGEEKP